MTSISSLSAQSNSPLQRLQQALASEVQSGTISSADQSALSDSLTDIDSELHADAQSSSGSRPSPTDMQSKIDGLIKDQVSSGKLTSDQGTELSNLFWQTFQGGPGGAGGPGGPPPGPPLSGDSASATEGSTDSSDSTADLIANFLKVLQQSQSSDSGYDTTGSNQSSSLPSLLLNYQA